MSDIEMPEEARKLSMPMRPSIDSAVEEQQSRNASSEQTRRQSEAAAGAIRRGRASMGDFVARNLKKQTARAKEKLLSTFGKADRTHDDAFDEYYQNFGRQQQTAERLLKAARNYVGCIRATAAAAHTYHEAIRELYEPNWPNKADIHAMTQSLDLLWDDYHDKLTQQTVEQLQSYASQFSDISKKIDKRGRKLLDYDSARHNLMALTTASSNSKSNAKDDAKIAKAQEQLASAQQLYVQLNDELLTELPALFDHRIIFYTTHIQSHYGVAYTFHNETAKVSRELSRAVADLSANIENLRVVRPHSTISDDGAFDSGASSPARAPVDHSPAARPEPAVVNTVYPKLSAQESDSDAKGTSPQPDSSVTTVTEPTVTEKKTAAATTAAPPAVSSNHMDTSDAKQARSAPASHSGELLPEPPNIMFKVQATHAYAAEDTDELTFEAGEIIYVVPYDDPEEQDEGWQMGIKAISGEKGVFPQNFTKNI